MGMNPNENYKAILELDKLLTAEGIPHELIRILDGWQICYPSKRQKKGDVVQHCYSYGAGRGHLEAMGFDIRRNDVVGFLTVEDAAEYFRKAWEEDKNDTARKDVISRQACS